MASNRSTGHIQLPTDTNWHYIASVMDMNPTLVPIRNLASNCPPLPFTEPSLDDLTDPRRLETVFNKLGILPRSTYLRPLLTKLISSGLAPNLDLAQRYFQGESELDEVCRACISSINVSGIKPSSEQTLADLHPIDELIHTHCLSMIKQRKWPRKIHLFSFGIGQGDYERHLKSELLSLGICQEVAIFGFDPNAQIDSSEVTLVSPGNLNQIPRFDIVLSRWVLHHVPIQERWSVLSRFLSHLANDSLTLIVEEGLFQAGTEMSLDARFYALFFALADVCINFSVLGHWIARENFYLKYLSSQDMETVESCFPAHRLDKNYFEFKLPFLRTVLLSYATGSKTS